MDNILNYVSLAFAVFGVLVTAGTAVVALTPTPKDDEFMAKVVKFFDAVSVLNPKGHIVVKPTV